MLNLKISGVLIFLKKRKTRMYVGTLVRESETFIFSYDETYFKAKNVIPLGPEFPLTQRQFKSKTLFPTFEDRIPSQQNPAYPEYCEIMDIDPEEKDPLILLGTIGRKGPSSFIFYSLFEHKITSHDIVKFRKSLGLTTREFANIFELSQSSLNAIECDRTSGKETLKKLEVIIQFPVVALHFLLINGGFISNEKMSNSIKVLSEKS